MARAGRRRGNRHRPPAGIHGVTRCFVGIALAILCATFARAATPETVLRMRGWSADGTIYAMARAGGTLYVGGSFGAFGPLMGNCGAVDTTQGALAAEVFPYADGPVNAVVEDGEGGWFLGGAFANVDGIPRRNIVHVSSAHAVDGWNPGADGAVLALARTGDTLYVGGSFNTVGGVWRPHIALLYARAGAHASYDLGAPPLPDDDVSAFVLPGDGTLRLGGAFTRLDVGELPLSGAVLSDASGVRGMRGFPRVDGTVNACADDGAGGWYIGGTFSSVGGVPRTNLAHVRADSVVDAWAPAPNGGVTQLARSGRTLYAVGAFTTIDGQPRQFLAAFDLESGTATGWAPNPNGLPSAIVTSAGKVYLGGTFSVVSGLSRTYLAAIDSATGAATTWAPSANGPVYAMAAGGGRLYVGGAFTAVAGVTHSRLAAFDLANGSLLGWNPTVNDAVHAIAVGATTVYVGGQFTSIGGYSLPYAGNVSIATGARGSWQPWPNGVVRALVHVPGRVYVGGTFTRVGVNTTFDRANVAAFEDSLGTYWAWNPAPIGACTAIGAAAGGVLVCGAPPSASSSLARQRLAAIELATGEVTSWDCASTGKISALACTGRHLYVGGTFDRLNGLWKTNLGDVDLASGQPTAAVWNPNGPVYALAGGGPRAYVGGKFTVLGSTARKSLAAIDTSTGAISAWDPSLTATGTSPSVHALAAAGSTLYVGGEFTGIVGSGRRNAAAIDLASGYARPWNPIPNGLVNAIAPAAGAVLVAGSFSSVGGVARSGLAAIDVETGVPTSWNPAANGTIYALAATDSLVYVGGSFTSLGGLAQRNLAIVSAATGLPTAWSPYLDGSVRAFARTPTTLYVGGGFTRLGTDVRSGLAALDLASGQVTPWRPTVDNAVYALAVSGATVYVGGSFATLDGQPRNSIGAVDATTGLLSEWNPAYASGANTVLALAAAGTAVYAAGTFAVMGGQSRARLAALDATTGFALDWNPGVVGDRVSTLALAGGALYVGGSYSQLGGRYRSNAGAVDANTGSLTTWEPGPDGEVCALLTAPSAGVMFVGGAYAHIGSLPWPGLASVFLPGVVGVPPPSQPASLGARAAPNPFRDVAAIRFELPRAADVTLEVFDLAGRVVARPLDHRALGPGAHAVEWAGGALPAGVYLYRLGADTEERVGRLVRLR